MGLITKDAILAAQDIKSEDVEVPEWNGSVRIREMCAADLFGFWDACRDAEGVLLKDRVQPALLSRTLVGEDGAALFTDADVCDLMKKSAKVIGRLFEAAQKLNGIGEDDEKNSEAAPSGASPSVSA